MFYGSYEQFLKTVRFAIIVYLEQLGGINILTYIFMCQISLYICFDRKAGNSLFHGQ